MTEFGIGLLALAAGVAFGVALVALRRPAGTGQASGGTARLEARLEVQAAHLQRLADAAVVRDGAAEGLRTEIAGARRALEELGVREQERRHADD